MTIPTLQDIAAGLSDAELVNMAHPEAFDEVRYLNRLIIKAEESIRTSNAFLHARQIHIPEIDQALAALDEAYFAAFRAFAVAANVPAPVARGAAQ